MPERKYPEYHPTVVGLSPGTMKQLSPADLQALVAMYHDITFEPVLDPDFDIAADYAARLSWRAQRARERR